MPKTTPFAKLVACRSWPRAMEMLKEERPVSEIADMMRDAGDYHDVSRGALIRQIYRWMDSSGWSAAEKRSPVPQKVEPEERPKPLPPPEHLMGELEKGLAQLQAPPEGAALVIDPHVDQNLLMELVSIVGHQKARVAQGMQLEQDAGFVFPTMRQEVSTLYDMVERMIKTMQSLGYVPIAPEKLLIGVSVSSSSDGEKQTDTQVVREMLQDLKENAEIWAQLMDLERQIRES